MQKNSIDTPVPNFGKGAGGANSLPTKTYPSSTAMTKQGKSNTIEGPCSGKSGYGK